MTLADSLAQYVEERKELQDQSLEISERLSKAKFGKRGALRRTLRKLKRSIRRADRAIRGVQNEMRKEGKTEVNNILANQGIDSKSNTINAIGGAIGKVGSTVGTIMTGGMGSSFGGDTTPVRSEQDPSTYKQPTLRSESSKNINTMYILGAVAVGLGLFMFIKKK